MAHVPMLDIPEHPIAEAVTCCLELLHHAIDAGHVVLVHWLGVKLNMNQLMRS